MSTLINVHGIVVLTLLLIGTLLAVGCTMSSPAPVTIAENTSFPLSSTQTTVTGTPVATLALAPCPQENASLFINVSPVGDHYLGDTIIFIGTTNLPAGDNFTLHIFSSSIRGCEKTIYPCQNPDTVNPQCCMGGLNRTVAVIPGRCGTNTWSFTINTSEYDFWPDRYIVYMKSGNISRDYGFFMMLEIPESSGPGS